MNKTFILDLGSGNTCVNDVTKIKDMIHAVSKVDPERKFILKWQLFKKAGDNIPLAHSSFFTAYDIASRYGYKTTASVFDEESLNYLMKFDVPFVKIACRPHLYTLIGKIPRYMPVVLSMSDFSNPITFTGIKRICCVPEYPASIIKYKDTFYESDLKKGISDHTIDWHLFETYRPEIYEVHFCMAHNNIDPDSGAYSRTPDDLKQIYDLI